MQNRFENNEAVAHLTNTIDETGVPDTAVLNEVIDHAEGFINSFCGNRYKVPVSTTDAGVAAMLKGITLDLAAYFLVARPGTEVLAGMQLAYDQAVAWLELIREGKAVLPSAATLASTGSRDPLFGWGQSSTAVTSLRRFAIAQQEQI